MSAFSRFMSDARSKPGDPDRQGRVNRSAPREAVKLQFIDSAGRCAAMVGNIECGHIAEAPQGGLLFYCALPGVSPKPRTAPTLESAQMGLRILVEAWFEAAHHPLPGTVRSA